MRASQRDRLEPEPAVDGDGDGRHIDRVVTERSVVLSGAPAVGGPRPRDPAGVTFSSVDAGELQAAGDESRQGVTLIHGTGTELEASVKTPAVRDAAPEQAAGVLEATGDEAEGAGGHRAECVRTGREEEGRYDERPSSHGGTLSDSAGVPQGEAHQES